MRDLSKPDGLGARLSKRLRGKFPQSFSCFIFFFLADLIPCSSGITRLSGIMSDLLIKIFFLRFSKNIFWLPFSRVRAVVAWALF